MSPSLPPHSSAYPPGHSLPPFPQMMQSGSRPSIPQRENSLAERTEADDVSVEDEDEAAANADGAAPKGKKESRRRRQVQSCSECRRRKIKCDKTFPCGPCVLRQDQSRCREVEKHVPSASACATLADLENLRSRLANLEAVLLRNGTLAVADLNASPTKPMPRALNAPIKAEIVEDADSDTEGAAMTLEHLAFGLGRVESARSIPLDRSHLQTDQPSAFAIGTFPAVYPRRLGQDASGTAFYTPSNRPRIHGALGSSGDGGPSRVDAVQGNSKKVLEALNPTEIFSMFYQRSDVFVRALLSVMPSQEKGEILVRMYLERVEWLHRCLHVPTFLMQCQQLWKVPVEELVIKISTPFLALYLIVCTLGLHFMDSAESALHFTEHEVETLPDVWFTAARGGMWGGDFLADHTIVGLQSLILMGVFLNNRDRADAAWALLGAGIKMAQGMGLSRLGGEGGINPKWSGQWASLTQREVGRRLWWNLVFLDWNIAPSYHYSSSIQPNQIKTALPANVEDEDLRDDQPLVPRPLSERTGMSYHLARLRFAEISQRQIYQANSSPHPPYSFILSVDSELRKAIAELPSFFAPNKVTGMTDSSKTRVQYYENIIINLSGHTRILRLHRPWLSRGYKDEKYAYSREQCIRAARASLKLMRDNDGAAVFLERWWIPLFYVTVSGSVVLIDLLRQSDKALHSPDSQAKIDEVLGAVRQMKRIGSVSFPARDAIKVLETLLAEVEERRHPETTLGKRKADGDGNASGLKRAVKKLIMDAEQSPSNYANTPTSTTSDASQQAGGSLRLHEQKPPGPPASDQFNFNASNVGFDPTPFPSTLPSMYPYQAVDSSHTGPTDFPFTAPPALDPTVTSMLSSYFPQSDASGQAPDDFLQRLLSFSWDGAQQHGQGGAGGGVMDPAAQASQGQFAPVEGWGSNGWMG